jgi:geranylgeranyl transferase type-2 subunit beta
VYGNFIIDKNLRQDKFFDFFFTFRRRPSSSILSLSLSSLDLCFPFFNFFFPLFCCSALSSSSQHTKHNENEFFLMTDDVASPPPPPPQEQQQQIEGGGEEGKASLKLHDRKHREFIKNSSRDTETIEYALTEHLRLSGMYWGLTANALLSREKEEQNAIMSKEDVVKFINECYDEKSSLFAGAPGHDGHVLYTLSAIQIFVLYECVREQLSEERAKKICRAISKLQNTTDGSFSGDEWGEVDTRFSYCAFSALSLLAHGMGEECFLDFDRNDNVDKDNNKSAASMEALEIDDEKKKKDSSANDKALEIMRKIVDVDKGCEFIMKCRNFDGGFGSTPGGESHAGQIFVCVGALQICNQLDLLYATDADDSNNNNNVDDEENDKLAWWLAERQVKVGGLNGRPEKLPDVCYSWWVLSSLAALKKKHWIDLDKLKAFILRCQDDISGGISDRPDDEPDVYHTFFGIAGLSLMKHEGLEEIDPIYALPVKSVRNIGIESDWY